MPRTVYLVTAVFLAILLFIPLSPAIYTAAGAADNGRLLPLTELDDYSQWFEQQTGHPHDAAYFGAYALTPISQTLYIGFGAGRPADADGALLARSDGVTVTTVATLTEQGFIGMTILDSRLHLPGVDPCCDDGWEWGNTYVYTPATASFAKYRSLPNVVHAWGIWADEGDGTLYTAVSFPLEGSDGGGVFRSTDGAQTWTQIADANSGVGQDRTYDIIGLHDKLYVTWNDVYADPCGLAASADQGQTWIRLTGLQTACRPRLFAFQDKLLALRADRAALYAVAANGQVSTHTLPGFQVMDWAYNYLATDAAGYLYTITDDGRVLRSADLTTWDIVAATTLDLITITYWPAQNWLVFGDRGSDARLWRLDLTCRSYLPIVSR